MSLRTLAPLVAPTELRERHRSERERIEHHIGVLRRMLETG